MTDRAHPAIDDPAQLGIGPEPALAGDYGPPAEGAAFHTQPDLVYESGLELKARSQWAYARQRFFRHRLAMISLILLISIFLVGILASFIAPYSYSSIDIYALDKSPTWHHVFGTDEAGRDYFSRIIYGIRTSARVALLVGLLSTVIGTIIGGAAGYYRGWVDNVLMRVTDLFLTLPLIAVLLTAAEYLPHAGPTQVSLLLAALIWTPIARIVRGTFLSLREKEYVEAAKACGAGDLRIMFRHMFPNTIGPILVAATLTTGTAILLESYLSFLGFGIQPPTPSLGNLISEGQNEGVHAWWLVTFPGIVIVLIVLCINFIGDGLRDALDPTQRRIRV
jgi:ABC-type dipeptide/oligopeptide/nickel transport system permease subunit